MKYLNNHKQELFDGQKITYRGKVYWANMTTMEIYAHSVDDEILGSISGYKVASITEGFDIVKEQRTDTANQKMKNTRITLSTVKSYGFTDKLIRELLPEPELVVNPHYRSGPKMKLWDVDVVESAMETEIFMAEIEKRKKRCASAKKAVQTKTNKLQLQVDEFVESVRISRVPLERLRLTAIQDKQKWYDANGIYDKFAEDADDATVKRWMVNYIRHNMVEYDREIDDMKGKTGKSLLYYELHSGVLHKISDVYPELKDECLRQIKREFR